MPILDATAISNARIAAGYATQGAAALATHTGARYYALREDGTLPNASRLVLRRWMKAFDKTYAELTKERT